MKYLKILGLAAIAATALMAFAGSASATTLTSPKGTTVPAGTTIKSSSEGVVKLKALFGTIECESSVEGTAGASGGAEVEGPITKLSWTNCGPGTCSATTLKEKTGSLKIKSSGGGNGTLTGVGQEVETNCFGLNCVWSTGTGTSLGTLTGSETTGATATLDISATINRTGGTGGGFCGSTGTWSGSYSVTTPDPLYID